MLIAAAVTALAAILGLMFAILVSGGITRPVQRLLEGTRAIEAGNLDQTVVVTSKDEIGYLTTAFNRMVEQLRLKEHIRRTFGKYVDPRVVEGLIDHPVLAAEGEHRVMTVMFCDVKGFTGIAKETTSEGLVKVMNRHFSAMSAPIRARSGIIDKYIGDAIMAYWGPPFNDNADQARLASLAALDMLERVPSRRRCTGRVMPPLTRIANISPRRAASAVTTAAISIAWRCLATAAAASCCSKASMSARIPSSFSVRLSRS
jgi:adenylate cyclase